MSTLNDAIKAEIAKLKNDVVTIKTEAAVALAAKLSTVEADIKVAESHLVTFAQLLEHDAVVAKDAIVKFFEKILHKSA